MILKDMLFQKLNINFCRLVFLPFVEVSSRGSVDQTPSNVQLSNFIPPVSLVVVYLFIWFSIRMINLFRTDGNNRYLHFNIHQHVVRQRQQENPNFTSVPLGVLNPGPL